jgi:hypothetical protein
VSKADRKIITVPPDWWAEFERAAQKAGKSVSAWLRDAGAEQLPASVKKKLSVPLKGGRPRNPETDETA